jgi:hypothetical protein
MGIELDTNSLKIGDGLNHWVDLPYLPGGGGIASGAMTSDQAKYIAQNIVPLSRGVDPAYLGVFGAAIELSLYGAPASGKIPWPDGGQGKFTAITIVGGGGPNPSTVESYKVTHRAHVDTSSADRTTWATTSQTFTPANDQAASALVKRTPELWTQNTARNAYFPSNAELALFNAQLTSQEDPSSNPFFHLVTGRCYLSDPTTDELIQWAAHKWGIPTDRLRAEMHLESKWSMDMKGDRLTMPTLDLYNANPPQARIVGGLDVWQSLGIAQVKWDPRPELDLGPGAEPLRWKSTAFNIDFCCAQVRFMLDDPGNHRTNWGDSSYVRGQYDVCQGGWFNPYPWRNAPMLDYVANIDARVDDKPWLLADFTNVSELVKIYRQPAVTRNLNGFITARPEVVEEDWVAPTPPTAAPTGLVLTPGDTTLHAEWTLVDDAHNGGEAIRGYTLTEADEGWQVDHPYNLSGFTFSGLPNGTPHRFTIAAYNDAGTGPVSAPCVAVAPTPATVPSAPPAPTGTGAHNLVHLAWSAPANGGSPITGYTVTPFIGATAQTPRVFGSTATSQDITGLTDGTAYTFRVKATNAVGTGANSPTSAAITPAPPAGFSIPPQIPIISAGQPAAVASEAFFLATNINDADKRTLWRSINPPTTGAPQWVAIDLRAISDANKTSVWAVLENLSQPRYQPAPATLGSGGNSFASLARNYKLRAHASSSSTCPAVGDAGWVDLLTVTDNRRGTRVHTGLNLSGYGWFQVYVTDASGAAGANDDVGIELELRNVAAGAGDSILVYGDSISMEGWGYQSPGATPWPDSGTAAVIASVTGRVPPVITDYSTGGWATADGNPVKADYLGGMPHKIWVLAFGHNDAHSAGLDLNTDSPPGVNSPFAQGVKTRLQAMVDYAVSQGANRVVIPTIPWTSNGTFDEANVLILNTIIDQIVAANPTTVQLGPDYHAYFAAHQNTLRDGIHPGYDRSVSGQLDGGLTGYDHTHLLWANWLNSNVYT